MAEDTPTLDLSTPYFPVFADPSSTPKSILDPDVSAILGGSTPALHPTEPWPRCGECGELLIPYIQINLASPRTPAEFCARFSGLALEEGETPILQVWVCAADENAECLTNSVVSSPDARASVIRILCVADVDLAASAAARDALGTPDGGERHGGKEHDGDGGEVGEEEDEDGEPAGIRFSVTERVIAGWTSGNPEVMHWEFNYELPEDVYAMHEPKHGLKLLGWPLQGKYWSSKEQCEEGEAVHNTYRTILQLGTYIQYDYEDNEDAGLNMIYTIGNVYVDQCDLHPKSFALAISGDW